VQPQTAPEIQEHIQSMPETHRGFPSQLRKSDFPLSHGDRFATIETVPL
jgi:hypothetical protein